MAEKKSTQKATAQPQRTKIVFVRAAAVHTYGNGLAGIEIPVNDPTPEERKLIRDLFPNTTEQVYGLLDKEALLAASHGIDAEFEDGRHQIHDTNGPSNEPRVSSPGLGSDWPRNG